MLVNPSEAEPSHPSTLEYGIRFHTKAPPHESKFNPPCARKRRTIQHQNASHAKRLSEVNFHHYRSLPMSIQTYGNGTSTLMRFCSSTETLNEESHYERERHAQKKKSKDIYGSIKPLIYVFVLMSSLFSLARE